MSNQLLERSKEILQLSTFTSLYIYHLGDTCNSLTLTFIFVSHRLFTANYYYILRGIRNSKKKNIELFKICVILS